MSSIAKFDVEKFDRSNDFGLWRVKMRCLLIQHGWEAALDPLPETMADAEKTATLKMDVYRKAHSVLLLCLDNKVLREVNKEDDSLRRCVGVDIDDEDQALMLLTSLPSSYDNFVETLFYGRESLTLEDVLFTSLNSPRVKKETDGKGYGDGLYLEKCALLPKLKRNLILWHSGSRGYTVNLANNEKSKVIKSGLPDSFWAETTVTAAYLINRSPSTALEKKTPMDLWIQMYGGYTQGCLVLLRQILKEVEFEVELQGSRVEPTVDPHTRENLGNEDEEQDEEPQQQNLDNYVLVRDRAKRTTTIPARYRDEGNVSLSRPSGSKVDDMAAYAFAIAEEEDTHEPITFQEAINSSEKDEWVRAMEEEMSSLKKNHTWELSNQLPETIYMRQPPGFEEGTCNKVCLLKKSLYGLKQSPRQWYKRFDVYMISNGFSRNNYDSCVYFKGVCTSTMVLRKEFGYEGTGSSLGRLLVMEIVRIRVPNPEGVSSDMCKKFYKIQEWILASRSLCHWGAHFPRDQRSTWMFDNFSDADYAKDPDKGRSITGYVFMVHGCVVSWKATLQHVVALSTTEAEYMALTKVVKESIWLKGLIIELGVNLRDIMESKEIGVAKIDTKDNAADAFTKVVPGPKFKYCMKIFGIGAN
ncbi:retrotransposon protein, putative, ty1-copia subclass [Tanacetum coccineum]